MRLVIVPDDLVNLNSYLSILVAEKMFISTFESVIMNTVGCSLEVEVIKKAFMRLSEPLAI